MSGCDPSAADVVGCGGRVLAVMAASFAAAPVSVREARLFVSTFLVRHDCGDLIDSAQLALSEVVTNAVLHAHTDLEVTLALTDDRALLVEVTDRNPQLPVQRNYADHATTGRGMELVSAVTVACGVRSRGVDGKTVWFVVVAESALADVDVVAMADWSIDADEAALSVRGDLRIVLARMPAVLWLAAREHHDALVRELALFAQEHPDHAPTPDQFVLADQARSWISSSLVAAVERHRRTGKAAVGQSTSWPPDVPLESDLELHVPPGAVAAFTAMQDLLDAAERLAVAGRLLARPGLPEIVAVRDWACEQGIAQLSGVQPSPWPGTAQERFTTEIRDREQPQIALWDATVVTEAATGAVAADDANRIIAVSRPLATALGWPVEELLGRRVVTLIPPELREAHVAGFSRHLATGRTHILGVPLQLPVLHADGTLLLCDVLIERSPTAVGRPVYVAWIDPAHPATDVG